jgi:hypothetical protein
MAEVTTLYDEDFLAWSRQQAEALRAAARIGSNQLLDWENLAEEIESLGISQRSALHSQICRIIRHLIKLEYSSVSDPRRGWEESIGDARAEIERLLETSPSLKAELGADITAETRRAVRLAIGDLQRHGDSERLDLARLRNLSYTADQILGDWFPATLDQPQGSAQ